MGLRWTLTGALLASTTLAGCTLDTTGLPPGRSSGDGGAVDAAPARGDASRADAASRPRDAMAPRDARPARDDGGARDAGGYDAGGVDAGPPRPSCDVIYGGVDGYRRCDESATSCTFYRDGDFRDCDSVCRSRGGACLGADENGVINTCNDLFGIGCSADRLNAICECSR